MAIEVGDGVFRVGLDDSALKAGMNKAEKTFSSSLGNASRAAGKALAVFGAGVALSLGIATKSAASFEQAITNAAVVTGKTGDALADAKVKIDELASTLGRTTVFTANQAADALGILARKGFDVAASAVEDMQPFLDLAAATMTDLSFSTDVATSTLKAFGLEVSDVSRVSDVFVKAANTSALNMTKLGEAMKFAAPVARSAGVSLEETVAALAQLSEKGTDASIAGTGLRRSFVTLLAPSGKFLEVITKLGLKTEDINLRTKSFADVLATLKTAGLTTADAMASFGDRGGVIIEQLAELNEKGSVATDRMTKFTSSLKDAAGVAETTAKEQLNTLSGQWTLLKSALESVAIGIGKTLLPMLTGMAKKAAEITQKVSVWVKENPKLTTTIVKWAAALGAAALVLGPILIALPAIVAGATAIGTALAPIAPAIAVVIASIAALVAAWKIFTTAFPFQAQAIKDTIRVKILSAITFIQVKWSKLNFWFLKNRFKISKIVKKTWERVELETRIVIARLLVLWEEYKAFWDKFWANIVEKGPFKASLILMGDLMEKAWQVIKFIVEKQWDLTIGLVSTTWAIFVEKIPRLIETAFIKAKGIALRIWDDIVKAVKSHNPFEDFFGPRAGPPTALTGLAAQLRAASLKSGLSEQSIRDAFFEQRANSRSSFANGGFPNGPSLVGERGPEIIRPPSGTRVFSNQESRAMGGGAPMNVTINVNGAGDPGATANKLFNMILQLQEDGNFDRGSLVTV